MTLDEMIEKQESVVSDYERLKEIRAIDMFEMACLEEHRQLTKWLKELKQSRQALPDIRAEIEQTVEREMKEDKKWALGLRYSLQIIDRYIKKGK